MACAAGRGQRIGLAPVRGGIMMKRILVALSFVLMVCLPACNRAHLDGTGKSVLAAEQPGPTLRVEKSVDTHRVKVGETMTYTIVLTNTGEETLEKVRLVDGGADKYYFSNTGSSPAGRRLMGPCRWKGCMIVFMIFIPCDRLTSLTRWEIAELTPSESRTFTVTVKAERESAGKRVKDKAWARAKGVKEVSSNTVWAEVEPLR